MANKSFISVHDEWKDIASRWRRLTDIEEYKESVRATEEINYILQNAPSDLGGSIPFGHTVGEADELCYKHNKIEQFTNSIHYEVVDLLEEQFVRQLDPVLQSLYDLSPKEFRTKGDFLFVSRGSSLQELLVDMVDTKDLRDSYNAMIDNLDKDEVSEDLNETINIVNIPTDEEKGYIEKSLNQFFFEIIQMM